MSRPTIDNLTNTVEMIDAISRTAFRRIISICKVSLLAMEQHGKPIAMEDLAQVLDQIQAASEEAKDCICRESEAVGCNFKDTSLNQRFAAYEAWAAASKVRA